MLIQKENLPQADINALNNENLTPLHYACLNGGLNAAKTLLQHGASIDAKDTTGLTPLHFAALNGHHEVVSCLLSQEDNLPKANVNVCNNQNLTPLHLACLKGKLNAAKLLLQHGASIDAKGNRGQTPLHFAAQGGHAAVISYLLIQKDNLPQVDVNACADANLTPLHIACLNGELNAAKTLLQHGASLDAKDTSGQTPLNFARVRGYHAFIMSLLENIYGNSK